MPKFKQQGPCGVIGCGKPIEVRGYCETHYYRLWKTGRVEKVNTGLKRKHPLYVMWHERKQQNILSAEWLDFSAFCAGVGDRPSPRHFLVRLSPGEYGPNNFKWQPTLKREVGETKKDWFARKWASRHANNPSLERSRDLKRKFGLTIADYENMLSAQNGVCAICLKEEMSFEAKSGSRKRLAVDHCHTSGKIRGLLCWICNSTLGKVEDSVARLEAMIGYLKKHHGD